MERTERVPHSHSLGGGYGVKSYATQETQPTTFIIPTLRESAKKTGHYPTMLVAYTELGRIATAICWENYMPLHRQYLYNQGVQIWCAPTVGARDIWQSSMRHIAQSPEGKTTRLQIL
ncbi:MAG: nitrilase-related carbon-nitrogen hydrolase [Terracidiphilus sp.]